MHKIFSGYEPRQNGTILQRFRGPVCLYPQGIMPSFAEDGGRGLLKRYSFILTRLVAGENFIAFSRREKFQVVYVHKCSCSPQRCSLNSSDEFQ
jgi:hypothetical protein